MSDAVRGSEAGDGRARAGEIPPGFLLGVATAAAQTEGSVDVDGRTPSTWDVFAVRSGQIRDGSTPDPATDSYRRWRDDLALLTDLGVDAYRFSLSWTRLLPHGRGPVNAAARSFYDRMIDDLLAAGIRPITTLFHWDTPAEFEARGGWLRRDTAHHFAEFATAAGEAFGDRVGDWVTLNEPATVLLGGYALGIAAPGHAHLFGAVRAVRYLLLAHGLAVDALRAVPVTGRIGMTNVHTPVEPATDAPADRTMAALYDFLHNRLFADAVLLGRRPEVPRGLGVRGLGLRALSRLGRDARRIGRPIDFYGLNYYQPSRVAAGSDPAGHTPDGASAAMRKVPFTLARFPELPVTGFDWPVDPAGLDRVVDRLVERYGPALPPILVTEGGASYPDAPDADGVVDDPERIDWLARHLSVAVRRPEIEGYLVWTLVDNWEWAAGFTQRFGLARLDPGTLDRIPKASYRWYRDLIRFRTEGHP